MTTAPKITRRPTGATTRRVRKTVTRTHAGRSHAVPDLAFW